MIDQVKTKQIKWEDLEVVDESTQIHQDLCEEITEWEEGNEPVPTRCKCCVKSEIDSLTIDWIPELIEDVIVDWHRPRVERWYIMPGLGPEAEAMMRTLCMLEITRNAEIINTAADDSRTTVQALVDSVTGSFDIFFKACSAFFEIRVLCVWDEFIWKMKRRMRQEVRHEMEAWEIHLTDQLLKNAWRPSMTEVEFNDLRARGRAAVLNLEPSSLQQECPPGVLDLGTLTKEEARKIRIQQVKDMYANPIFTNSLAFCTPSRFGLTGRQ